MTAPPVIPLSAAACTAATGSCPAIQTGGPSPRLRRWTRTPMTACSRSIKARTTGSPTWKSWRCSRPRRILRICPMNIRKQWVRPALVWPVDRAPDRARPRLPVRVLMSASSRKSAFSAPIWQASRWKPRWHRNGPPKPAWRQNGPMEWILTRAAIRTVLY